MGFNPEFVKYFDDGTTVEIEKVGGGTIGKKYTGEHWYFRLTRANGDVEEGLSYPHDTLYLPSPATHQRAATFLHDFYTE